MRAFEIREIRVTDRNRKLASMYVDEMREKLELDLRQTNTTQEAVKNADIIVTATTSKEPFLRAEWLKSGSFISAIGSYQEVHHEVTIKADKVVVDNLEQVKHRGNIGSMFERGYLTEKDIHGELEEIVVGKKKGRETDDEIILLVPIGMGSEDVAVAYLAFKRAKKEGLGQRVAFF
jgi:ornithine cyclodeaminase/alanine dehydrogenase-like protein (mu-crystallin family)